MDERLPPPARRRKPALLLLLLLLAAGLAIVAPWAFRGRAVGAYAVVRTELVQTVVATGRVSALARVEIGSLVAGTVAEVAVEEGARVERGQVLLRLREREALADERAARAALDQARAGVAQAAAAEAQAEARLRLLQQTTRPAAEQAVLIAAADLEAARRNHERVEALVGKGMLPRADLDEARRALDAARARFDRESTLAAGSRPGGGDERAAESAVTQAAAAATQARAAVAQAAAALAAAQSRLADTVIAAPVDGTVISRTVEVGSTVQPGRTLLVISRPGRTEIVAPVDEKNLALLAVGQKAVVSADAYPGRSFPAELSTVVPAVAAASGTVTAKFSVPAPPEYLLPDMTVSVEVEVARTARALSLPAEAVRDLSGAPWVLAVRDGRARRVPVRVGARGASRVEVLSGLAEGELVLPAAEGRAADGDRVRVARRLDR
jgi:HlyD family secretion protein